MSQNTRFVYTSGRKSVLHDTMDYGIKAFGQYDWTNRPTSPGPIALLEGLEKFCEAQIQTFFEYSKSKASFTLQGKSKGQVLLSIQAQSQPGVESGGEGRENFCLEGTIEPDADWPEQELQWEMVSPAPPEKKTALQQKSSAHRFFDFFGIPFMIAMIGICLFLVHLLHQQQKHLADAIPLPIPATTAAPTTPAPRLHDRIAAMNLSPILQAIVRCGDYQGTGPESELYDYFDKLLKIAKDELNGALFAEWIRECPPLPSATLQTLFQRYETAPSAPHQAVQRFQQYRSENFQKLLLYYAEIQQWRRTSEPLCHDIEKRWSTQQWLDFPTQEDLNALDAYLQSDQEEPDRANIEQFVRDVKRKQGG